MNNLIFLFVTLFLACWHGVIQARTQYITDKLQIPMRSGQSNSHKILRMLPSGTSVEILAENKKTGYSRIRALGEEGWIISEQLMDEPSASEQLSTLKERLQLLQSDPDNTRNRLITLQTEHQTLQRNYDQINEVKQRLEQELEVIRRTAADAVKINSDRVELRKSVASLTREKEDLKQELRDVSSQLQYRWFLSGAGVLFFGIFLGIVLPRLRLQRRREPWGNL